MLFNIIFLHTILQITKQILTFCLQKRRQGFFELFVGSAERKNEGWASIKGSERCGGGTKKVVLCQGRKWSAEGKTVMATDDWRALVLAKGGGRGRRRRKVCILAAGQDTAVERESCNDRHGREVEKK
jgi:hypothetical protein